MDLRRVYTFRPSSTGTLQFSIAPNSVGAMVLHTGQVVTSETGFAGFSGVTPSGLTTVTIPAGATAQGALVDARIGSITAGWGSTAPPTYQAFRNIVAVADVNYTGTTLNDSGSVTVDTIPLRFTQIGSQPITYSVGSGTSVAQVPVNEEAAVVATLTNIGTGVNSVTMPARKSFTTRVLGSGTFTEIRPVFSDLGTARSEFGYLQDTATTAPEITPSPNYAPGVAKVVKYTGLDPDSTITISVRYCVQLTVQSNNSMYAMAKPSPPAQPNQIAWYDRLRAYLPTVEQSINAGITLAEYALPRIMGGSFRPALGTIGAVAKAIRDTN